MQRTLKVGLGVVAFVGLLFLFRDKENKTVTAEPAKTVAETKASEIAEPSVDQGLPRARRRGERGAVGQYGNVFEEVDALVREGRPQDALKLLEALLQKDPNHERALEEIGMLYLSELQDVDKAISYFKQALTINPQNEFAVMELVGVSLQPDKTQGTAQYLEELYRQHPTSAILADGLAEMHLSQGRVDDAIPFLENSAKDPRYNEFSNSRLAALYEQKGEPGKAKEHYEKAIAKQAEEIEKLKEAGQSTELVEADQSRTKLDLAHLKWQQGEYDEAEKIFNEAAAKSQPGDYQISAFREMVQARKKSEDL